MCTGKKFCLDVLAKINTMEKKLANGNGLQKTNKKKTKVLVDLKPPFPPEFARRFFYICPGRGWVVVVVGEGIFFFLPFEKNKVGVVVMKQTKKFLHTFTAD